MLTKRKWRKPAEGEVMHQLSATVSTDVLNAIEEKANRERISRAYAAGLLIERGIAADEHRVKQK